MIKGIDVVLIERTSTGKKDDFNMEVFEENEPVIMFEENEPVIIHNVLVGSPTSEEIVDTLNLYGKKIDYVIAVPKEDNHKWKNSRVKFFGRTFEVVGIPTMGIEENIPLCWNKKVKVEAIE